jgi:hypothetical protein
MDEQNSSARVCRVQASSWNTRTDDRTSHHGLRETDGPPIHYSALPVAPPRICPSREDIESNGEDFWPFAGEV